ncbi:MAG: CoA-binding protein [Desulfohalobiaceae bacterium]|nr:CoA-binding protein [Desulfohalobiaceae bacterium]
MHASRSRSFQTRLRTMFEPENVAVVGATNNPEKLGSHVMKSLLAGGFAGGIIPVNPNTAAVMGLPAAASLEACEQQIDLLIVVIPAAGVPEILRTAVRLKVGGVVLITAGFSEIEDPSGRALQARIKDLALSADLPVIGPNTFGMVNPEFRLNSSFTPEFARLKPGRTALLSQSGGIAHLMAFLAERQVVGLGKIVGLGNRLTVDFHTMLHYLSEDARTRVIAMYIEGLDRPGLLLEAARAVRGKKPLLAYKAGDAGQGDQVSRSHTGSMAGNKAVYHGAFRQHGIFPVYSSQDLLDFSRILSCCPLPGGPRVAVLSGQAGPNMTACDILLSEGLELARFSSRTRDRIHELLPPLALRENPVDMGPAWYSVQAVQGIVRAVLEDEQVDVVLVLTMYASANRGVIPGLSDFFLEWNQKKPLITCFSAPQGIWDDTLDSLEDQGAICNLPTPEQAARMAVLLWQYTTFAGK